MQNIPYAVYNMGPVNERVDNKRGVVELRALANNFPRLPYPRRKALALLECKGRDLPDLAHYKPVIHDQSRPERANLGLYILDGLKLGERTWVDHKKTWNRVERPGEHEGRATLIQEVEDETWIVSHAPQFPSPKFGRVTVHELNAARVEWVQILAEIIRGINTPLILFSDPNGLQDDLKRTVPTLKVGGTPVEAVHVRGGKIEKANKVGRVNGVRLLSDHHGGLVGRITRD